MKKLEKIFESFLWNSRLVVLFAVLASLTVSLCMFFIATIDVYQMVIHILDYADTHMSLEARNALRSSTITHVVEAVDGYLLATVMLIFSLGLYELFISKIDVAESQETSTNVLVIHSLDDLKNRLLKVIMMILVVKFFEHAISMNFKEPLELLILAAGVALLGLAMYLTHASEN